MNEKVNIDNNIHYTHTTYVLVINYINSNYNIVIHFNE